MTSASAAPPTLPSMPSVYTAVAAASPHRRSYSCYNCNYSFHITPIPATAVDAPSSFRCPSCHHRHLIPHHTIAPVLPTPPPPPPPPPQSPAATPLRNSSYFVIYHTDDDDDDDDDESDSDEEYESDNSLLSFATPSFHSSTPALKSFVASLPIKTFSPNAPPAIPSCSICIEDFEIKLPSSAVISELPCEHYFHRDCIVKWLQRSNTCPLCRYKLPVEIGGRGEGTSPGTSQAEVENDAVPVLDLPPRRGAALSRVDGEQSVGSNAAVLGSGSDRVAPARNGGELSGLDIDPMRDEDGDILMVDA
ncbi:RING-H2 finger protein ATL57-like [Andrographis paniculata]|uniref:RING-H2 finger protein ATL57-like n=1 Tax=Andrographis paniculata TaxID=175694 RepID=UPI0021E85159|nr:RING-H2 finger protein ATL57-like [Andrographis paniculata]